MYSLNQVHVTIVIPNNQRVGCQLWEIKSEELEALKTSVAP